MQDLTVLLIEDNADDRELALWTLRKADITRVSVARDGLEALAMLHGDEETGLEPTCTPDVVFLDLRLPRIDGLDVLRRIRDHVRTGTARVIVLTSSEDPEDQKVCRELGVLAFVSKPLTPKVLAALLPREPA